MSLEAMVWALRHADTDGPLERLVLVYLADRAGPHGEMGGGGMPEIAAYAGVTYEAAKGALDRLMRRELVSETDRVWWLAMPEPEPAPLPGDGPRKAAISDDDREWTYERDRRACLRCGEVRDLTIDHVIPECLGGASDRSNYQTLCRHCNAWKGTRTGAEFDYREKGEPS